MSIFDQLVKGLRYSAYVPSSLGNYFAGRVGGNNGPGVTPSAPPIVGGTPNSGPLGNPPFQLPVIQPEDPMQNYLNQLLRGVNAGRPDIDSLAELRARASKQAGLQFDPEIQALIGERNATKGRATRNRKEIGSLYGDLADEYLGDIKTSKKQTAEAKKTEKAAYNQLQKDLTGQYSKQLDNQSEELKDLGLSAALGESTKGQKEDLGFLKSLNATESGAQQRAIDLAGLGDASFYQKGSNIAKHEGAETISDLMTQLEEYMRQTGGQLSSLKGQKASAVEQLFNQFQNQQGDANTQFENNRWNRLLQIAQLQRSLTNDQISQMGQGQEMPSKGLEGALGLLNQSLGGNSQNSVNAFMNLLQTQEFREGRFQSKDKQVVKMTPENAAYQARQYALQHKLSPQETDALVKSVYAYYGKLR